jgi:cytochrome P450
LIEAAAILATLLQRLRFRWAGHDEPVPVARLTLIPRGGIPLAVSPRE